MIGETGSGTYVNGKKGAADIVKKKNDWLKDLTPYVKRRERRKRIS